MVKNVMFAWIVSGNNVETMGTSMISCVLFILNPECFFEPQRREGRNGNGVAS